LTDQSIYEILKTIDSLSSLSADMLTKLAESVQLLNLESGEILIRQGEKGDAMYFLASGTLDIRVGHGDTEKSVATVMPGAPVGETQLLVGGVRTASVYAAESCLLVRLTSQMLRKWEREHDVLHDLLLNVIRERQRRNELSGVLVKYLGQADTATVDWVNTNANWVELSRGEVLFEQGASCTSWYVLIEGLLEVCVTNEDGVETTVGRVEKGGSFGEAALLSDEKRTATIRASRDSELIELTRETFDLIREMHPEFMMSITRMLVGKLINQNNQKVDNRVGKILTLRRRSPGVSLALISAPLADSLQQWGQVDVLDIEKVRDDMELPQEALEDASHPAWHRIRIIVHRIEHANGFLLLEESQDELVWNQFCRNWADEFVDVVNADDEIPAVTDDEDHRPRTLLLAQPAGIALPTGTASWLEALRPTRHLHLRSLAQQEVDRLGRVLSGNSVGLVLGGGGARGFAHIGAWRALEEIGVPIDSIGGTSIGSVMSGNIALGRSEQEIIAIQRKGIARKPFKRYTFPIMSLIESAPIDEVAKGSFADLRIEDLWIPFFCVSADITAAEPVIHREGLLWKATRASGALPVISMPVLHEGHLLVDGGLFNNLPADVMKNSGLGHVIAVNVSPDNDMQVDLEELPTNRQLFMQRFRRSKSKAKVPKLGDILVRTMVLSSRKKLTEVTADIDLQLDIPVENYGMLQFEAIDELVSLGYEYTKEQFKAGQGQDLPRVRGESIDGDKP